MQSLKSLKLHAMGAVLMAGLMLISGCDRKSNAAVSSPSGPPPPIAAVVEIEPQRVAMELSGRIAAHLVAEVPPLGGISKERLFTEKPSATISRDC